ncbi:MAG: RHS repeat-associated core domain-containing protein, partial [Planctomycetota bacterium]
DATSSRFDRNGNLVRKEFASGADVEFAWDLLGRLESVTTSDGSTNAVIEYEYDPEGYRIGETTSEGETRFLWDHSRELPHVIAEYEPESVDATQFVIGNALHSRHHGDNDYHYHTDALGSVIALSDEAGVFVNRYRYDAYGTVLEETEAVENDFQFTGEVQDDTTGLSYLRARYLDNQAGRFVSVDPFDGIFDDPQSLHRYQYAHQNPAIYIDPTGETSELAKQLVAFSVKVTLLGVMAAGLQQAYRHTIGGDPVTWTGVTGTAGVGATAGIDLTKFASLGVTGGVGGGVSALISTPFTIEGKKQSPYGAAVWHAFANAGIAASLNTEGEGGVGGISLDVPGAQWLKNLGAKALIPTYAILLDANVSAGVGRSKGALLFMGFGQGSAEGRSIGASLGISGTFVGGVALPLLEGPAGTDTFNEVRSILRTLD